MRPGSTLDRLATHPAACDRRALRPGPSPAARFCTRGSGQTPECRIGPHVIVLGEELGALARLQFDRDDLLLQPPGCPGIVGALLAADGVLVLRLAADPVLR